VRGGSFVTFSDITYDTVNIRIYNLSGEQVRTLNKDASSTEITWDLKNDYGREVSSGVYFYFIENSFATKKGKIAVVK